MRSKVRLASAVALVGTLVTAFFSVHGSGAAAEAMIPVLMLSIVGNQQFNNAYPLWSEKNMDLVFFGWQVPVTWLQAVTLGSQFSSSLGLLGVEVVL